MHWNCIVILFDVTSCIGVSNNAVASSYVIRLVFVLISFVD